MRKKIRRRHDAHARASGVCTEHRDIFDVTPGGQKARLALGGYVADVDRLLGFQERCLEDQHAAVEQLRRARRVLRDGVRCIVMIGRLVRLDDTTMATLRLIGPVSDDKLLAHVRAVLDRVSPYVDAFVAEGLPPDLLKNMQETMQRFVTTRNDYAAARQRFSAASESILETLAKADDVVDALDELAVNARSASPEVLTKLRIAKRVGPRPVAAPDDQAA